VGGGGGRGRVTAGLSGDMFGSLCMGADGAGSGGWAFVSTNGSLRGVGGVLGSAMCGAICGGMSVADSVRGGSAGTTVVASGEA
jgi:hypothetical protein